jgi:O-antigen ligase
VFDILNSFIADARVLVLGVIGVLAIVFVGMTWMRTRSLAPTLAAVLLGAVVVYAVNNFDDLSDDIEQDVSRRRVEASDD